MKEGRNKVMKDKSEDKGGRDVKVRIKKETRGKGGDKGGKMEEIRDEGNNGESKDVRGKEERRKRWML